MKLVPQSVAVVVLIFFAMSMALLVLRSRWRTDTTSESFLVANRNLSWRRGAMSIAVSWIWAPAIFIAPLQAYHYGLAGAFWFIIPNVLCFFLFAPVAIRVRRAIPQGYSLPEYMRQRFEGDAATHIAFLLIYFGYQLGAIIINSLAGGVLLNALTGIDISTAILSISAIALGYSLLSGLRASVHTDVVQMAAILLVTFLLIPWTCYSSGGLWTVASGIGGISGDYGNVFHPGVAYAFGIAMSFGLIAGPIADQMFFQRAFAVPERDLLKTFIVGGLLFAMVPILLASLGFIAASASVAAVLQLGDPQMVGPAVIAHFLPRWALLLFMLMAIAGLCSTLDSAYCAISSLGAIDIYRRYVDPTAADTALLSVARRCMLFFAVFGTGIALLQPKLIWLSLIYGVIASAGLFPVIMSVFWSKVSKEGVFTAIVLSFSIGFPLSVYANVTENTDLIVLSSVATPALGLLVCLLSGCFNIRASEQGVPPNVELVGLRRYA